MATRCAKRAYLTFHSRSIKGPVFCVNARIPQNLRQLSQTVADSRTSVPDFAFAFDIDGVLLRSSNPIPQARGALSYIHNHGIPFILLTNGGGRLEQTRTDELSKKLGVPLSTSNFVQSHTPFAQLVNGQGSQQGLKDKCVLVVGGDRDNCRQVAESYGFNKVITPTDLIMTRGALWPFVIRDLSGKPALAGKVRRVGQIRELSERDGSHKSDATKIDAILVFNDPRDWALDIQIILDLLMSRAGYLGSLSAKNGDPSLPNRGWQQDDQPPLYFSNPDLFWAAAYHLPRMGQGAFREAFRGVWNTVTGGPEKGVELKMHMFGKPHQNTFEFAEKRLQAHRREMGKLGSKEVVHNPLKKIYMIGDNPESDILGANSFQSKAGIQWTSILVRSGVYSGGEPAHKPKAIEDDVGGAVKWALSDAGCPIPETSPSAITGAVEGEEMEK